MKYKWIIRSVLAVKIFGFGVSSLCFGETLTLQEGSNGYTGTTDTSIYQDRVNNTNGGHPYIFAGATVSSVRRGLIRFELPDLPEGAVVDTVTLELTVNRAGPSATDGDPHTLHRLLKDWGEGTASSGEPGGNGTPAQTGDATWSQNFRNQTSWDTPGGDFNTTSSIEVPALRVVDAVVAFSSDAMVDDVNGWLQSPQTNFGWIIIGDEEGNRNARRFVSSEGASSQRPRLVIEYTIETLVAAWEVYK